MSIDQIVNLIGSTGFPIVCCIILFRMVNTTLNDVKQVVRSNTETVQKLIERLKGKDGY